jgi:serine/threonine protein kinase
MSRCPHCGGTHGVENHFCPVTGQPIELGPRLISQQLLDRFKVKTILGEGPISIVLEVEEVTTGKPFAAKLIHPQYTRGLPSAENLLQDAKRSGELDCPHLAKVVEVGRDTGAALTVIRELMNGECLETRLAEKGTLPIDEGVKITRQILVALDAIHGAGLVNLDLSPADVFLAQSDGKETVKLVDIGEYHIKQALVFKDEEELESRNYYAPEQYDKSRQANLRSDIYAAGVMLYQMITGQIPSGSPEPINQLLPSVPTGLALAIHKSISSTAKNRYQTANDFIHALDNPESEIPTRQAVGTDVSSSSAPQSPDQDDFSATSDPEDEQPSVIVDMPEMEKRFSGFLSGKMRIIAISVVMAIAVVAAVFFLGGETDNSDADDTSGPKNIFITIEITPKTATVSVDGHRVEGNPPIIDIVSDSKLHTITAKAEGFESLERDVKFDSTKTINLDLAEIIEAPADGEDGADTDIEEIQEIEEVESPPVEEDTQDEEIVELPAAVQPEVPSVKPAPIKKKKPAPAKTKKPAPAKPKKVAPVKTKKPAPIKKKKPEKKKKKSGSKTRDGFNSSNPFG